jgi:hypothetical protein
MNREEEKILGLHVYRVLSESRFVCSLMPSGAIGIIEGLSVKLPEGITPEKPVTVLFSRQLDGKDIQWSSQKKCFMCKVEDPGCMVLV